MIGSGVLTGLAGIRLGIGIIGPVGGIGIIAGRTMTTGIIFIPTTTIIPIAPTAIRTITLPATAICINGTMWDATIWPFAIPKDRSRVARDA